MELTTFYKNLLFESRNHILEAISKFLETKTSLITEDHNKELMWPIEEKEVEDAITQIQKDKVPDPDGFTVNLFHFCWCFLKWRSVTLWKNHAENVESLTALNSTFLTLIPKE